MGFWTMYFAAFWRLALTVDAAGNLVAGHVNIWGDWAVHLTMTTALAYRSLWLTTSPLLLDAPFRYPFAANWLSAVLVRSGWPLVSAMVIPSFLASVMLVGALFVIYKQWLGSSKAAMVAALVFLLSGGWGGYFFLQDIWQSPQPLQTLLQPPHEYTRIDEHHIKFINVIDSMIIPQRGFTLGFPLALFLLTWLWQLVHQPQQPSWLRKSLAAGFIAGMLPLIHTHSFLMVALIMMWWIWLVPPKNWRPFWVVAAVSGPISIFLISHYFFGPSSGSFLKWWPGWYAKDFGINWLEFWWWNWGLVPYLAAAGWLWLLKNEWRSSHHFFRYVLMYGPFFLIFVLGNLWLWQPFIWDNTKLFVWTNLGWSALVAWFLAKLWHFKYRNWSSLVFKSATIFFLILIIFSGSIDAYRIQQHALHSHVLHTNEELQLSRWVLLNTSANSTWLTGDAHNHWLYNLTGRQPLLTFRGWLWTHGYEYQSHEVAARTMFVHPMSSLDMFNQYRINYVVVGPNEKREWFANESELGEKFSVIHQTKNYTIYSTSLN